MTHPNPFFAGRYMGHDRFHLRGDDRMHCVDRFTAEQCERALKLASLQKTVRVALERRLRKLDRGRA